MNFEFQYYYFIFFLCVCGGGGGQKNEYFWGYEDFVDTFFGHHKIDLYLRVIPMHFMSFSVQNEGYFGGVAKSSNIFGGT